MKDLSIIVPVYNEARTVREIMDALAEHCAEAQIIYVDDGSNDASLTILREHARPQDIVLTKENGGKGSAIRLGITQSTRTFTVIQDADLEYHPKQIALLYADAQQHPDCAIFGSRFLTPNPNLYRRYLLGNKAVTLVVNVLFFAKLTDSYTCYKLFPTAILRTFPLKARGFELEAELSCFPLKRGMKIREVPIHYAPRSLEEGKKIRFKDAWIGVLRMLEIRLTGR